MNSSRRPSAERASLRVESLEDRLNPVAVSGPIPTGSLAEQVAAGQIMGDRVIAVLNSGTSASVLSSAAFVTEARPLGADTYSVRLTPGTTLENALADLSARPGVQLTGVDNISHALKRPNDPRYSATYGMYTSGAQLAWNVATGTSTFVVADIDSGVDYTHPDLYQNIWLNQKEIPAAIRAALTDVDGNGLITFRDLNNPINQGAGKITDLNGNGYIDGGDILRPIAQGGWADGGDGDGAPETQNGYVDDLVGWDFANDDNDPFDDDSHGTHVAGTLGANGNDGIGVAGMNWNVQIMALKFLGPNGGSNSAAIAAINYAIDEGVKVSNNSWGGLFPEDLALTQTMARSQAAGHIFVAAAGNDGFDNDGFVLQYNWPSNYTLKFDNVITVAAIDSNNTLADFSNYGARSVTIAAPGVQVLSTIPGGYDFFDGTSMATPHVAGALALYWGANPTLTYQQVVARLKATAAPVDGLAGKMSTGARLDVASLLGYSLTTPPVVVNAPVGTETVRVLAPGGSTEQALDPYPGFMGGVVSAAGDITGDKVADVVTAAARSGHIKAFDGATGAEIRSFLAFPGYLGSMSVAVGDINGDGIGDIIVAANLNGHVKVFDGTTGLEVFSSLAYQGYTGAVSVTTGDTNADGVNELITAADGGAGVHVKTFTGNSLALFDSFMATSGPAQWPGFDISAQDLDGDEIAELLISQGPRVRVLNSETKKVRADFLAFDPLAQVPVTVQASRYLGTSTPQLVAVAEVSGRAHVKVFDGPDFVLADSFMAGSR